MSAMSCGPHQSHPAASQRVFEQVNEAHTLLSEKRAALEQAKMNLQEFERDFPRLNQRLGGKCSRGQGSTQPPCVQRSRSWLPQACLQPCPPAQATEAQTVHKSLGETHPAMRVATSCETGSSNAQMKWLIRDTSSESPPDRSNAQTEVKVKSTELEQAQNRVRETEASSAADTQDTCC